MIFDYLEQFGEVVSEEGYSQNIRNLPFKYLGLYFTADWCSSCVRGSDKLRQAVGALEQQYPQEFKLITIRMDQTVSDFGYHYWRMPKLEYPSAVQLTKFFSLHNIPTILVFNKMGQLITKNGYHDILAYRERAFSFWEKNNA